MQVRLSVSLEQRGSTLDGFPWNLVFEYFAENSIKFKFH